MTTLPISVQVPARAQPGDYLSGISVQTRAGRDTRKVGSNVAISSVERYAVGLETMIPGARTPKIALTGASVERQPAGVTFLLRASNTGNVILQNVRGTVSVTRGGQQVASSNIGPGTFVTGTTLDYPIPAPRQGPSEGTVYRVQAVLSYPGGNATLDRTVTFGKQQAIEQQRFGGPPAKKSSHIGTWVIGAAAGVAALGALGFAYRLGRRGGPRA
jgi:hypothetical protein